MSMIDEYLNRSFPYQKSPFDHVLNSVPIRPLADMLGEWNHLLEMADRQLEQPGRRVSGQYNFLSRNKVINRNGPNTVLFEISQTQSRRHLSRFQLWRHWKLCKMYFKCCFYMCSDRSHVIVTHGWTCKSRNCLWTRVPDCIFIWPAITVQR